MKRTLRGLAIAFALTVGIIPTAPASAQELGASTAPSFSFNDENSSAGPAAALDALTTTLGADVVQAVQQGLLPHPGPGMIPGSAHPAPAPAPAPPRGDCSPQAFNNALWEWRNSNRTVVEYCDGSFAWVSQRQTDWRVPFEFNGQRWNVIPPAGTTKTGMTQGCYNGLDLRYKGASDNFINRLPICTPDEIGYSPW